MSHAIRSAAALLVDCLAVQGCERIFTVPGESFLAVLDALPDRPEIAVVGCEGLDAAATAEAEPLRAFGGMYITDDQYARWKAGMASPEFRDNLARALREWEEEATGAVAGPLARG